MAPYLLKRTLSSTNQKAAQNIYKYKYEQYIAQIDCVPNLNRDVIKSSMVIPAQYGILQLTLCTDEERLSYLQIERSINWCESSRYLVPFITNTDGNCMLHSVSMYIFGVQDRDGVLRKLLYQRLFMEKDNGPFCIRWKRNQEVFLEKILRISSHYYTEERDGTWRKVLEASSDKQIADSSSSLQFNMLTDIHIFVIANIIGRAIIVLCNHSHRSNDRDTIQATKLDGVYLPILRQPKECEKSPIVIGFKNNHFVPLISSENLNIPLCDTQPADTAQHCIPLVHSDLSELPIRFLLDREETADYKNTLLGQYLEICSIPSHGRLIEAALLKFKPPPAWSIELLWSLYKLSESVTISEMNSRTHGFQSRVLCVRSKVGCENFASENTENMCGKCYEQYIERKRSIPRRGVKSQKSNVSSRDTDPSNVNELEKICINPGCNKIGHPDFLKKCRTCYMKQFETPTDFMSTLNKSPLVPDLTSSDMSKFKYMGELGSRTDDQPTNANPINTFPNVQRSSTKALIGFSEYDEMSRVDKMHPGSKSADTGSFSRTDQLHYNPGNVAAASNMNGTTQEFDRTKVLCDIPGCENTTKSYARSCDYHHENQSDTRRKCIVETCHNFAEQNDNYVCMMCLQSNKHLIREFEEKGKEKPRNAKHNIGRGNTPRLRPSDGYHVEFENLAEIAHSLPPLPSDSETEVSQFGPKLYQGYGGQMSTTKHAGVSSAPVAFQPPQVYEGFVPGGKATNFGAQHGVLNWQKERIASGSGIEKQQQQCQYCDNHANPAKNGFCNHCYDAKMAQQGSAGKCLRKCINDGCRAPGREDCNFLCEGCYEEQLEELQPMRRQPPRHYAGNARLTEQSSITPLGKSSAYAHPTNPCITRGCVHLAALPSRLCDLCQQNPPSYERFVGGRMENAPTIPTTAMENTPITANQIEGVRQQCKALDCEFFGSVEYGGYCSSCFLDITKQETAKKQSGIRTFAPPSITGNTAAISYDDSMGGPNRSRSNNKLPRVQGVAAPEPCQTKGCDMFGRPEWNGYCSRCYKNQVERDDARF